MSVVLLAVASALFVGGLVELYRHVAALKRHIDHQYWKRMAHRDPLRRRADLPDPPEVDPGVLRVRWFSLFAFGLFVAESPVWLPMVVDGSLSPTGTLAGLLAGCAVVAATHFGAGLLLPWDGDHRYAHLYGTLCVLVGLFGFLALIGLPTGMLVLLALFLLYLAGED